MSDSIDTKIERFSVCEHCQGSGRVITLRAALNDIEDKLEKMNRNYVWMTTEYQKVLEWQSQIPTFIVKLVSDAMKQGGGK